MMRPRWLALALVVAPLGLGPAAAAAARSSARPATVAFENDLPGTYQLRRVQVWVDGGLRYDGPRPLPLVLPEGQHFVSMNATYQMRDPLLPYVGGYTLELRAGRAVRAEPDSTTVARAIEAGGVTTPVQQRAHIVWR